MNAHGWCLTEQADVPIGTDRRCLTDGRPCIPPSWSPHTAVWTTAGRWEPDLPRPDGYTYRPPAYLREYQRKAAESIGAHRKPAPKRPASEISASLDAKLRPAAPPRPTETPPTERVIRCEVCRATVVLKVKTTRQRYCSEACRMTLRRTRRERTPPPTVTCPTCTRPFVAYAQRRGLPQQTYCSEACRKYASTRRRTIHCRRCGVAFVEGVLDRRGRRRFCSDACAERRRRTMRERGMACAVCGDDRGRPRPGGLCNACHCRRKRQEAAA